MTPLDRYREKRDFARTPEPAGDTAPAEHELPVFVIQKHAASRLHYDFRLEIDGVLASWAVPKGPSLDPHDKRLAVHVEDHPLEYGSFEGTIPAEEYGGGTVMLWDRGTYEPELDMRAGLERGDLKFTLNGSRLSGSFALVRMKPRPGEKAENWLLIKHRDEQARPHEEYDVTAAVTTSVATGRTMDEIASGALEAGPDTTHDVPTDTPMQLATLVSTAPTGPEWVHEVKYDGYRARIALSNGRARVLTRTGADWTERFGPLARAAEALPVSSALLDGEIVALGADGVSDFGRLQQALSAKTPEELRYMAFDLLSLEGHDLRDEPLLTRKDLLARLLESAPAGSPLRFAEHVVANGHAFHHEACTLRLEGSVSKRGDRPYVPGRGADWVKVKCLERQEFVVLGWTDPGGTRDGFGALLLGVHEDGALRYAGRVGTGFSQEDLRTIAQRLEALATNEPPVEVPSAVRRLSPHWIEPRLVAEVAFREWTRDGIVRQPSFKGLREDKDPSEIVREAPVALREARRAASARETASSASTPEAGSVTVAGVRITHPDKVLYPADATPAQGITKLELARYYEAIWPHMAPHLVDRPLTLVRCPHGAGGECFYQKHPDARGGAPAALQTITITEHGRDLVYLFATDLASLESLVQLGVLEIHAWNSRASDPERPDRIVLDLDPGPGIEWPALRDAAFLVRDALRALELEAFAKTTGGKGLHVVVPITPDLLYDDVRGFAHALVERIETADPDHFTARMALERRPGRVFIDYLRNAHGATAVVAFSTRARAGAPVGVPVSWTELETAEELPTFTTASTLTRVTAHDYRDPWSGYEDAARPLSDAAFRALGVAVQGQLESL